MKKVLMAFCLMTCAASQVLAGEFLTEPSATAYISMPLAASQTGKAHSLFGFRMDQMMRDQTGNLVSSFSSPIKAPAMDMRFDRNGVQGIYLHGINLASPTLMRMAEDGNAVMWIVGGFAVGAAALIIDGQNAGGSTATSSCSPCTLALASNSEYAKSVACC
jgi:hypothetical protein